LFPSALPGSGGIPPLVFCHGTPRWAGRRAEVAGALRSLAFPGRDGHGFMKRTALYAFRADVR
jgi:pimeloyl-ACP methyl ester carboxylesterase